MKADLYPVPQNYAIDRWGEGYFGINPEGHVTARPDRQGEQQVDLYRLGLELRESGLSWPVLIRFTDILQDRVATLCQSFRTASEQSEYRGRHTAVYPVKVNQQRMVVEEILNGGEGQVGLEAGSKPELMIVLAQSTVAGVIVCNGYKDREYVRLALIGLRLGHQVYLVIEKPSELALVLTEAADLGVAPLLGVRVRLSSSAAGNWQNSGGEKAKFGLTAGQLLELVRGLEEAGQLDRLQLLHSHIGSQIPNLGDIRRGVEEVARFYGELRRLGAGIQVVDVGGGLGVDYEGTGTRHFCSANYTIDAYAREVVKSINRVCRQQGLPHPDLFTEAGRAITAHHAVLMVDIIDRDPVPVTDRQSWLTDESQDVLQALHRELMRVGSQPPSEVYQEAYLGLEEVLELFEQGKLSLEQRALAEELFFTICRRLRPRLRPESKRDRDLLDRLRERLADRLFGNFSLFQSLPDVWAIDQIFPVMPLHRLTEAPLRSAILYDLTCDSDGCIADYVDQDGVESTLPVHEPVDGEPYLLGIFLVGAYQEILGDMHNLFGDTNAVNLELDGGDDYRLTHVERGDTVEQLLRYVHFDPESMLLVYRQKLERSGMSNTESTRLLGELQAALRGYTYFKG